MNHEIDHVITTVAFEPLALEDVWNDLWRRLSRGAGASADRFHTAVLATNSEDGSDARHVVLRGADPHAACLYFHTDRRSSKLAQIEFDDRVCMVFYGNGVQIRVRGIARLASTQATDAAWVGVSPELRRLHALESAPGTPCSTRDSNPTLHTPAPHATDNAAGRNNFALLEVQLQAVEWLQLIDGAQRRAGFGRSGGQWISTWMVP